MTRSEFARYMGVHKSQTTRWCAMGMPTNSDGSISPELARTWVRKNVDPTRRALVQRGTTPARRQPAPLAPPGTEHLSENIVQAAIACVLPLLAHRAPRLAAAAVMASGASRETAESVYRIAVVGVMMEVSNLLTSLGVPAPTDGGWAEADMWQVEDFVHPDWEALEGSAA